LAPGTRLENATPESQGSHSLEPRKKNPRLDRLRFASGPPIPTVVGFRFQTVKLPEGKAYSTQNIPTSTIPACGSWAPVVFRFPKLRFHPSLGPANQPFHRAIQKKGPFQPPKNAWRHGAFPGAFFFGRLFPKENMNNPVFLHKHFILFIGQTPFGFFHFGPGDVPRPALCILVLPRK